MKTKTATLNLPESEMNDLNLMSTVKGESKNSLIRIALRAYKVKIRKEIKAHIEQYKLGG